MELLETVIYLRFPMILPKGVIAAVDIQIEPLCRATENDVFIKGISMSFVFT